VNLLGLQASPRAVSWCDFVSNDSADFTGNIKYSPFLNPDLVLLDIQEELKANLTNAKSYLKFFYAGERVTWAPWGKQKVEIALSWSISICPFDWIALNTMSDWTLDLTQKRKIKIHSVNHKFSYFFSHEFILFTEKNKLLTNFFCIGWYDYEVFEKFSSFLGIFWLWWKGISLFKRTYVLRA